MRCPSGTVERPLVTRMRCQSATSRMQRYHRTVLLGASLLFLTAYKASLPTKQPTGQHKSNAPFESRSRGGNLLTVLDNSYLSPLLTDIS
jgi:hypothetical protein